MMGGHRTLHRDCLMAPTPCVGSMSFWLTRNFDRSSYDLRIIPFVRACSIKLWATWV